MGLLRGMMAANAPISATYLDQLSPLPRVALSLKKSHFCRKSKRKGSA